MNKLKILFCFTLFLAGCMNPTVKKELQFQGTWVSSEGMSGEQIPFKIFVSGKKFRVETVEPSVKIHDMRPKLIVVSDGMKMFIKQASFFPNDRAADSPEEMKNMFSAMDRWDGSYKTIETSLPKSNLGFPWAGGEMWWNSYELHDYKSAKKGEGEIVAGRETFTYEEEFMGTFTDFIDKEYKILLKRTAPASSQCLECKEIKYGPVSETYFTKP